MGRSSPLPLHEPGVERAVAVVVEQHRDLLGATTDRVRDHDAGSEGGLDDGLSHAGSPGLAAFQSAKSSGSRFCSPGATRSPARRSSRLRRESFAYSG